METWCWRAWFLPGRPVIPGASRALVRQGRLEKHWEGCGGLVLTDEIKLCISAQACLLTLNLPHDFYPNVESILVYPSAARF